MNVAVQGISTKLMYSLPFKYGWLILNLYGVVRNVRALQSLLLGLYDNQSTKCYWRRSQNICVPYILFLVLSIEAIATSPHTVSLAMCDATLCKFCGVTFSSNYCICLYPRFI